MLKKIRRRVKIVVTKPFQKKPRRHQEQPPSPPPPSPPAVMPPPQIAGSLHSQPFLFPQIHSTVLPDPSKFFAAKLLSSPLPTNSFFQNFVLNNGDQHENIHPYLVKSSESSLHISYPSLFKNSSFFYQIFIADLIISTLNNQTPNTSHVISSFGDLSVTLDFPSAGLRFHLVRGSPFLTCEVQSKVSLSISTVHAILKLNPNSSGTKYTIKLNNTQTWLLYASSPIHLTTNGTSEIISDSFSGIIRIAVLPDSCPDSESILDRFSTCYPVSGKADLKKPFQMEYKWDHKGWGDLVMLAHPLHRRLLDSSATILNGLKYNSIDGELIGVVGDSWVLKTEPISVNWHSDNGIDEKHHPEINKSLVEDVKALNSSAISTSSSYFYGKLVARAARLALIAEEICHPEVIPVIRRFLKDLIEPWLEGTFVANGFFYDKKWGGLVTKQGSNDSGGDFGFGIYNDHHFHIGYFLYGISVLAKHDHAWGRKYKSQAYSLMADYMNLKREDSSYTRLRCFDFWKLHSWASGLTEFADGRNQESTSEAVNGYYSAALMGLAYGDSHLISTGSSIMAFEIQAARMWWHVETDSEFYPKEFTNDNRIVGVLWSTKRDSGLWFAPPEWRECRTGIQLLPLSPISESLFPDVGYVKELVKWTDVVLGREGVGEGWKGFLYALQGVYDREGALVNIGKLKGYDDGNSLTNLLWWVYSRGEGCREGGKCWYRHYCH